MAGGVKSPENARIWLSRSQQKGTPMKYALEVKFTDGSGLSIAYVWAAGCEELAVELVELMAQPGFSDATIVKVDSLPEPAHDDWEKRLVSDTHQWLATDTN